MNRQRLRIGSVPYLNACVLVHGLALEPNVSLEFHPPSILAAKLACGDLDVALASSIECFRHPEYAIVPGLSISGFREMWSIRLFHRVPLTALQTVALDPSSETTNALLQVLLRERSRSLPRFVMPERSLENSSRMANSIPREADGFLLIGDPALTFQQPGWMSWDLQSAWFDLTGLPFVYALWHARPGVDVQALGALLRKCRDEGLQAVEMLAAREAPAIGLTRASVRAYIAEIVGYALGENERAGLRQFQRYVYRAGLIQAERTDL